MTIGTRFAAAVLVAVAGVTLAGCAVTGDPMPVPTSEPSSSPTGGAVERDPVLRPGQSAAVNQQFFDFINEKYASANGMGDGRTIVDNLVASGFEKADMEVTPDTTAINLAVDSIIVSVRINDECLIGQFSPSGYTGIVGPLLGTGRCLVGETRAIDW